VKETYVNHEFEHSRASTPAPAANHDLAIEPGQSSRSALMRKPDHAIASGLVQRKPWSSRDGAPALRAVSLSSLADSFAAASPGLAGQVGGDLPVVQRKSAADVADAGFAGAGHEIPHRQEMERSFGMDFGHVRAHSDAGAAQANHTLGSHAYAMGSQVAFKTASPSPALVAHELTHVLQQAQSPSFKGGDGGIDTSGEAEAEAVEAAVAAGQPAHTALRSISVGGGPGLKAVGPAPARKKRGPALESEGGNKFGMGMTFSLDGFEKAFEYTVWKGHIPIASPVPLVNILFEPNVKVSGKGAAKYAGEEKGNLSAQLGVFGECGIGLSGGIADVAELFGTFNPAVEGAFTLTKHGHAEGGEGGHKEAGHQEAGHHKEAGHAAGGEHKSEGPASTWSLAGAIGVKSAFKLGVSLGGGIVEQSFELGSMEICKLTGVYFDQTGFRSDKLGFEWSGRIRQIFDWIKDMIDKARHLGRAALHAAANGAKAAGRAIAGAAGTVADAAGDAAGAVADVASDAAHGIASAASDFGSWVTSW
jgi:hypothetical protein